MKHLKLALAVLVAAALVVPTAYAKKKAPAPSQPTAPSASSNGSQAGGLPATNARVTALEQAVYALRADLNAETAARKAADDALANEFATIPHVFISEGSVNNLRSATATVASKTLPAGRYFILAAVQMTNSQMTGDAKARCVMFANGNLLADTSDLLFPILATGSGTASSALGSTIFAPLQGSYTSNIPITVRVDCNESNGDNGGLDAFVQLAAMKAGTLQ